MNTHADKTQENKSQSVANEVSQKQSGAGSTFQFVDNRPEAIAQRKLQEMANNSQQVKQAAQLQSMADNHSAQKQQPIQKKENNTGLPNDLKTGIESLSGYSMDDVKVHYNSDKPTQLQALAYAQGSDIHLASGQEKHLPHEAWHVVQQKQGRVKPTMQMKGKVNINDDAGLEKEADVMGEKALQSNITPIQTLSSTFNMSGIAQLISFDSEDEALISFRRLIQDDEEGESLSEAKQYLEYAQDKEWDDLEDEAMTFVRFHDDFDTGMIIGDVETGSNLSLLVQSAQISLKFGAPTSLFVSELVAEVGAKDGPNSEGMKYFGPDILKAFGQYLDHDSSDPEVALHRAIWKEIGSYMDDEKGNGGLDKYSMGIQKAKVEVGGFILHFTNRTRDEDVTKVSEITNTLIQKVGELREDTLTSLIQINFRNDTEKALDVIESTTQGTHATVPKDDIAKANRQHTVAKIRTYSDAVVKRWHQVADSGKIHIVFDRAKLDDAYGKSSANAGATPQNMMEGNVESLQTKQRITINLDSEVIDLIYITLAHEIAHAMGFNPTGMDAHGHFNDLDKYMEAESTYGSKLLFDAYYFETLIQHLY